MAEPRIIVRKGNGSVGLVLVHDITGVDAANLEMADKFAAAGLWVAAVDLFQGHTAPNLEGGMKLRAGLTPEHTIAVLRAGLERLRAEMGPDARIGSLGFCMGGGAALVAVRVAAFAFCVDYYGRIDNTDDVKGLRGPLLLILASEDDRINTWACAEVMPNLDEHRKRVEVQIYPGVGHAFHRQGWAPYNEAAAQDALARAVAFCQTFDRPTSG